MNKQQIILKKRINKLPYELVNIIISYTYTSQNPELLLDIRSFHIDYSLLEILYHYNYNERILLNDILIFYNSDNLSMYQRLERLYTLSNKSLTHLIDYAFNISSNNIDERIIRKRIRILWAILSPVERTRFINTFFFDTFNQDIENMLDIQNNIIEDID